MRKSITPDGLPLLLIPKLFHVGSLDADDKGCRAPSNEGNGLSVSLHPEAWTSIARLGGFPTWEVSLPSGAGRFLDSHALTKEQNGRVEQWAVEQGLLTPQERWEASWLDEDDVGPDDKPRRVSFLFNTKAEALSEYEESEVEVSVVPTTILCATEKAHARCGFNINDMNSVDIATTFYAEDHDLDGVWWNDRLAVHALLAPRGVINVTRLAAWDKQCLEDAKPAPRRPRP